MFLMRLLPVGLCAVLCLTGCGGLQDQREVIIPPAEVRELTIAPVDKGRKVTVSCASPGTPVNVYLVLAADRDAGMQSLQSSGKPPAKVLDSKEKTEDATLTATVPANSGCAVLFTSAGNQTATVKVQITGK
jgi:hypothetical protein